MLAIGHDIKRIPLALLVVSILLAAGLLNFSSPVLAQTDETSIEEPVIEKPGFLPPAYNDKMARLAEVLGAVQYLRKLCGAAEGLKWREQMENIIAGEQPTAERKADLVSRFNRGFRSYREIHRECTPTAVEVVNSYMRQGTRLAGEIPNQYGR